MRNITLPGMERFPRLSNVTATLLHISMLNFGINDDELRGASYNMLCSVLATLNVDKNPILNARGMLW